MKLFGKPVNDMNELELRYFKMEVDTAVNSVLGRYSGKGAEFLMAVSIALRDQAGKSLYSKNQPKPDSDK